MNNGGRVICPAGRGFIPFEQGSGLPDGLLERTIALGVGTAPGGVAQWRNDFPFPVMPQQARLVLETASSGAGTVTIGKAANIGSLPSAAFAAGVNVNTTGVYNTLSAATVGSGAVVAPGEAITVSQDSGSVAGLAGYLELTLIPLGLVNN